MFIIFLEMENFAEIKSTHITWFFFYY